MDKSASSHQGPGLIGSVAGLAKNAVGLLLSRLELATIEPGTDPPVETHLVRGLSANRLIGNHKTIAASPLGFAQCCVRVAEYRVRMLIGS